MQSNIQSPDYLAGYKAGFYLKKKDFLVMPRKLKTPGLESIRKLQVSMKTPSLEGLGIHS